MCNGSASYQECRQGAEALSAPSEIADVAARLIPDSRINAISKLEGGGNNRKYIVETGTGRILLKHYFANKEDKRDRMDTEYAFSSFLWEMGIRNIPRPLAADRASNIALYEFVEGRELTLEDVSGDAVRQAENFFAMINRYRNVIGAERLPVASEACFSIESHIDTVRKRVSRLEAVNPAGRIDEDMLSFLEKKLVPEWTKVSSELSGLKSDISKEITNEDRVLSPSDFGFHNALLNAKGEVVFLDFEYAGWDDPAKTIGDFFSQVERPVPLEYFDNFILTVSYCAEHKEETAERARLLLPLYRIKWCCIILNHFLPLGMERRRFASASADIESNEQLTKAKRLLLASAGLFSRRQ